MKTTLYGRLRHNKAGSGYIHFHEACDEEYFAQLTAERQQLRSSKGFVVKEWVKKSGDRNEALDCFVYAFAALQLLLRRYDRRTVWDQLERQVHGQAAQQVVTVQKEEQPKAVDPVVEVVTVKQQAARRPARLPGRSGGFVSGWK